MSFVRLVVGGCWDVLQALHELPFPQHRDVNGFCNGRRRRSWRSPAATAWRLGTIRKDALRPAQ